MSMNKKDFIALADLIRNYKVDDAGNAIVPLDELADFCAKSNSAFKRGRWLEYIAGRCGPNGGARRER